MRKEQIIQCASELFAKYGIRNISMDTISQNLNISKRTLYEVFEHKTDLLQQCIENQLSEVDNGLKVLDKESESVVESLVIKCMFIYDFFIGYSPVFYEELKRYPNVTSLFSQSKEKLANLYNEAYKEAVNEGFFESAQGNIILLAVLRDRVIKSLSERQSDAIKVEDLFTAYTTLLRAVCTAKGLEELSRVIQKWSGKMVYLKRNNN